MHYSKNYNTYAPFDLLTVDENELIYVEVKSTTSDVVYFSKQEIKFANEH
jgi:Holliday junction resolvase